MVGGDWKDDDVVVDNDVATTGSVTVAALARAATVHTDVVAAAVDTVVTTEVTAGTGAIDEEKRAWMPRVFCRSVNQFRKQDCRKAGAGAADEEEKALRLKACGVNAVVVLEGAAMSVAVVYEQETAAKKSVVALA